MKKINRTWLCIVVFMTAFCTSITAQKYYVYQFEGKVCAQEGRKMEPVTMRQCLDGGQKLFVDEGASVKLLDMSTRKFNMIRGKVQGKVSELSPAEKEIIDISKEFNSNVYNKLICTKPKNSLSFLFFFLF